MSGTTPAAPSPDKRLRDLSLKAVSRHSVLRGRLNFWLIVMPGIGVLILQGIAKLFVEWKTITVPAVIILGIVIVIVGLILNYDPSLSPEYVSTVESYQGEIDKLQLETAGLKDSLTRIEGLTTWISKLYVYSSTIRDAIEPALTTSEPTDYKVVTSTVIDILVSLKLPLMRISDERWNIAVYLPSEDSAELECVVCRRPDRDDEERPHRSWLPGEGHVGRAFKDHREYISSDADTVEMRAAFQAPAGKAREYDSRKYRSFAALPIQLGEAPPMGVIIATSDVPHRFEPGDKPHVNDMGGYDAVEPLRATASVLALLYAGVQKSTAGGVLNVRSDK